MDVLRRMSGRGEVRQNHVGALPAPKLVELNVKLALALDLIEA